MQYVYFLESLGQPGLRYKGTTRDDPNDRVREHNSNHHGFTANKGPWELVAYVGFTNAAKAFEFEKYVKKGSGWAFANKHFYGREAKDSSPFVAPLGAK